MSGFFAMGGYAFWVWSAYALTVVIMVANVLAARSRFSRCLIQMRRMKERSSRSVGA